MRTRRIVTEHFDMFAIRCDAHQTCAHGADPQRSGTISEQRHDGVVVAESAAAAAPLARRAARFIRPAQAGAECSYPDRARAILREGSDVVDGGVGITFQAMSEGPAAWIPLRSAGQLSSHPQQSAAIFEQR